MCNNDYCWMLCALILYGLPTPPGKSEVYGESWLLLNTLYHVTFTWVLMYYFLSRFFEALNVISLITTTDFVLI